MNKSQKIILIVTAFIITIMLLFPQFVIYNNNQILKTGYGFAFNLPQIKSGSGFIFSATVNASTLLVQIFGVLVVGSLLCLSQKDKTNKKE